MFLFPKMWNMPMRQDENTAMTTVQRDTPTGEMLRRYWWPVGVASDLKDKPTLVRLLGEDLVLFRTADGKIGLIDAMCAHRCANLALGVVEGDGLRCRYHGWKYGCDGAILDIPHNPNTARVAQRVKHAAYPAVEQAGVILAYLGPAPTPLIPQYDFLVELGDRIVEMGGFADANWLQCVENGMDPNHVSFLHGDLLADLNEKPGKIDFIETEYGLAHATQRPHATDPNAILYREHHIVMPGISITGAGQRRVIGGSGTPSAVSARWTVPIDDEHSMMVNIFFKHAANTGRVAEASLGGFGRWEATKVAPYQEYLCEIPRALGYIMPKTVPAQDATIVDSMGPIVPRHKEFLVEGDEAIVRLRRLYRRATEMVAGGKDPVGVFRSPTSVRVNAHERVIRKEVRHGQPAEV